MSHNINAGDPGAITDLQAKLSRLERDQERMKTVNYDPAQPQGT